MLKFSRVLKAINPAGKFVVAGGSLEWMKLAALVLMTGDHVNKALFAGALPILSEVARVCFPLFAFVLVYNLLRPGVDAHRAMRRMVVVGLVAQPFHALVFGYYFPLNVMFTLALGVWLCCARGPLWWVITVGLVGGFFVDYQWFGLAVIVTLCVFLKAPAEKRFWPAVMLGSSVASLEVINGNQWAWLAIPAVGMVIAAGVHAPRWKWLFYAYYPAHLAGLAVLRWW